MVELHTTASNKTGRQIKRQKMMALGAGGQPHTAGTSRLEHQAPLDELQLHWNLVYTALEHPCCWLVPTQSPPQTNIRRTQRLLEPEDEREKN